MTILQFIKDKKNSENLISNIMHSAIQTVLDINYPGVDANSLSKDQYKMMFHYIIDNFTIEKQFTGGYVVIPKN